MTSGNSNRLIPRSAIFGNPSRTMCQISPDGTMFAWIAPRDGVLNIWIAPVEDIDSAEPITDDRLRGIRFFAWARNNTHLLYIQDEGGDEDWHVHSIEISSKTGPDLTPLEGVNARITAASFESPDDIIIGINDRDKSWHDLYRVNVRSGERDLLFLNDQEFSDLTVDNRFSIRLATKTTAEGGGTIFRYENSSFETLYDIPHEDILTTHTLGFEADGDAFYMIDSCNRDRAALMRIDFASGAKEILGEHPNADITGYIMTNPQSRIVDAYGVNYLKLEWHALNGAIANDLAELESRLEGEFHVASRTHADDRWIVSATSAAEPGIYYLYDRASRDLTRLFSERPELDAFALRPMHAEIIPARDGLELVSYLTLPKHENMETESGRPSAPVPMVLLVHGGPWARDAYGYHPQHQWLADRGYAVLSVNFRGSTGFGKAFINAGDLEWGRKMHDDLIDAIDWAVEQGIAGKDKVAIMGGSYGGYATLAGLAFTPDVFACGVDIVGPSNLETLIATTPPYWKAAYEILTRRIGDPRTEEGRTLLADRSPLTKADQITKPLLIGQGANDPRVKQAESDQIVSAMQDNSLPVTYVLYPDEGHGFARPENRLSFFAVAEAFLSAHLGGSLEPIGDDFSGSTIEVPEGAVHIPGLGRALG